MTMTVPVAGDAQLAISVVVPAYNSVRWIDETLSSILAQSLGAEKLEVIVVDDGSSDGTAELAERRLADSQCRWKVLRQANRGPGAARNTGWRASSGIWIQFLDADDLIDPEKLAIQLHEAEGAGSDVAVIYSSYAKFGVLNARFESSGTVTPEIDDDVVSSLLENKNTIVIGSQIFARDWLERVGGWNEEYFHAEDHFLLHSIAFASGRFLQAPSNRPLFYYRRLGAGFTTLSTRSGRSDVEARLWLYQFIEKETRVRGPLSERRSTLLAKHYGSIFRTLAMFDQPAADEVLRHVYELDPNYEPDWSNRFRMLAKIVGFRRATWLAVKIGQILPRRAKNVTVPPPAFASNFGASSRSNAASSTIEKRGT